MQTTLHTSKCKWRVSRTLFRLVVPLCVATLLATLAPSVMPTAAGASEPAFHVVGNKVIAPNGQEFVPYGFVLYCLAQTNLSCLTASSSNPVTNVQATEAAARFWHSNVVRIQVAQEHLFDQQPYDKAYLAQVDKEVDLVNSLRMVAIVTLQEEEFGGPPMPTATTTAFWKLIAAHYKSNANVFFDLYNEPRLPATEGESWLWNIWRNGGTAAYKGTSYRFVGMQSLVNTVRSTGANNIIIAEGNGHDKDLSGIPQYALDGSNIAYGMEPDLKSDDLTPAQWAANWGNLSDSVPILMEAFQQNPSTGSCLTTSPTVLPQLLNYLHSKNLGLIVWTLSSSADVVVGNDLQQPTSYQDVNAQTCASLGHQGGGKGGKATGGGRRWRKKASQSASTGGASTATSNSSVATGSAGPGADILTFFKSNSRLYLTAGSAPTPTLTVTQSSSHLSLWVALIVVIMLLVGILFFTRRRSSRRHVRRP
jgi:hypothetical protein